MDNRSYEQELIEDLISIIHCFTMKSYSHKQELNKIRKDLEKELINECHNNKTSDKDSEQS